MPIEPVPVSPPDCCEMVTASENPPASATMLEVVQGRDGNLAARFYAAACRKVVTTVEIGFGSAGDGIS